MIKGHPWATQELDGFAPRSAVNSTTCETIGSATSAKSAGWSTHVADSDAVMVELFLRKKAEETAKDLVSPRSWSGGMGVLPKLRRPWL